MDGSVNSGGTLEGTVTWTCYMTHDDTLADEIEDATEDDVPYEVWIINKRVQNTQGKYKAEYRQGYFNSITRSNEADGIAEFEVEYGTYLKRFVATLHYQTLLNKTKHNTDSTTLSKATQPTMVLLKAFHNQMNLNRQKRYNMRLNAPIFII